jgi:hypothetical protein
VSKRDKRGIGVGSRFQQARSDLPSHAPKSASSGCRLQSEGPPFPSRILPSSDDLKRHHSTKTSWTRSGNVSELIGSGKTSKATPNAKAMPHSLRVSYAKPTPDLNSKHMPSCSHVARIRKHPSRRTILLRSRLDFTAEHHADMLLEAVQVGFVHDWSLWLQRTKADPSPSKAFEQASVPPYYMKVSEPGPRFRDNAEQVCGRRGLLPSWVVRDLCCRSGLGAHSGENCERNVQEEALAKDQDSFAANEVMMYHLSRDQSSHLWYWSHGVSSCSR